MSFKDFIHDQNIASDFLTTFGKGKNLKPFKKEIEEDLISYSLYSAKGNEANQVMVALKTANFKTGEGDAFLTRSAIYAARILRDLSVDIIVSPMSSSDLTKEFVKRIKDRTHLDVYVDSFKKQPDISKVEIDRNHPKITDAIIKSMETTIERAIRRNHLSVKMFSPMHRKFIKNMFEITDAALLAKFEDKKVVVIDDIMTTGTSAKNIADVLLTNGAAEVSVLTIFKST
jgi:pyrimidine operon attenuation protein/uracil phosphoribosyltransferase